jgi:hypothetical protein
MEKNSDLPLFRKVAFGLIQSAIREVARLDKTFTDSIVVSASF